MIFYFTGTGNSLWVAKALSEALGEQLVSIAEELHKEKDGWGYPVRPDEKILFVYPVHSWGPAVSVTRFISRLTLNGYTGQSVYSVSTCGDECGYTDRLIGKALEKRAISLTAAYSVIMPNNYILLPGFDVDDKMWRNGNCRMPRHVWPRLSKRSGSMGRTLCIIQEACPV